MSRLGRCLLCAVLTAAGASARAATYDAIVIDDTFGRVRGDGSYAVGQGPTAREAQRIAMSNCTAGGNLACALKLTYQQCGAYAASDRRAGTGTGADMRQATQAAMSSCADAACRLVVADCIGTPLRPPQ